MSNSCTLGCALHLSNMMGFVECDCFPLSCCVCDQKASSAAAWLAWFFHGGTGLQCHCWVSTLPSTGLQKTFISGKHITQYLLCLERNKRNEKMGKDLRKREMRKEKNTKYVSFLPREGSVCKLTLIISWHLKTCDFQMRPYSYICRERLGNCG